MSQFLVLSHISIQNANSIVGLTWGFPALTHFLGFTHALSRKVSTKYDGGYEIELDGCAVISHEIQNKVGAIYVKKNKDRYFSHWDFVQSRNPPVLEIHKNGKKVPVIEEGKMNLTVSLVIELKNSLALTSEQIKQFELDVRDQCEQMRLAGGTILQIANVKLLSGSTDEQQTSMLRKVKRLTMPGFVLVDRSHYLDEHYQALSKQNETNEPVQLLDSWLDFSALKYKALPILAEGQTEPDENTDADWVRQAKPKPGYLVPLMIGYKAISEVYEPGEVLNTRDSETKSCFVEAIHSIGEWKGVHRIKSVQDVIWRYQHDEQWYLCTQKSTSSSMENTDSIPLTIDENQLNTINDALNLLGK